MIDPVVLATIPYEINNQITQVPLIAGGVLMIAGPNGAGKSALLFQIYKSVGGRGNYYPGHRQVNFNNGWDNLGQDIEQLKMNMFNNFDVFNRYKSHWSEDQFKSVVRRIQYADAAHNSELLKRRLPNGEVDVAKIKEGPIETLNRVFESARMAVRFSSTGRGLRAKRDNFEYDIDQLSDGERAALLVAGAIIVQAPYTILLIDEPERHLHPSISAPLIGAAVRARNDIAYAFASHDINLIAGLVPDNLIYIRNSTIISLRPEIRNFDFVLVDNIDRIDENLRKDILGARQSILFVEGDSSSLDAAIYNVLYPQFKVVPKGGADTVIASVKTLNDNPQLHWINIFGLIDSDGRDKSEIEHLEKSGIKALSLPTIENLIYLPEVIKVVCDVIYASEGGMISDDRIDNLKSKLLDTLELSKSEIVSRITTWRINRAISESKVSVSDVRDGIYPTSIDATEIKASVEAEMEEAISSRDIMQSIRNLPIKNTPLPAGICKLIGLHPAQYRRIVLRQIELLNDAGQSIVAAIRPFTPSFEDNYIKS